MRTLGIIANCTKSRAKDVLERISAGAADAGLTLLVDDVTAGLLAGVKGVSPAEMFDRVDAVMALGGDGTLLRVVRELGGRDIPVIGVNIGGLGFLTSVAENELDRAVQCLATDEFNVRVSAIVDGIVERAGREIGTYHALNDIVIARGASSRIITLDVAIDGDEVTSYVCDGLIVSTPSGSTGYSMSAGGPIIVPTTQAFVVSVICPHTLSSRPLVVPDSCGISITAVDTGEDLMLAFDGQTGQTLVRDDRVIVRRSKRSVRLIHLPGHSYFAVLRQKLGWSGSSKPPHSPLK